MFYFFLLQQSYSNIKLNIDWINMFGFKDKFLDSKYRNNFVLNDRVAVKWLNDAILSNEFEYMVQTDMAMAAASIVFVLFWMCFHMRSFSLSLLGMYQIVMSIPIALFIYRYMCNIYYFQSLHQMVIFLVLGIGADDIFVFVDGWKIYRERGYDLKRRMHYTFERTFKAVFHTSFTTISAFCAMAASPIIPMRTFGIFAALAILTNFIFVITLTPAAIVLWEKGCCGSVVCVKKKKNEETKAVEMTTISNDDEEVKGDEEETKVSDSPTKKDEFLEKYYLRWLLKKPCAWTIVVVLSALSGFLVSSAAQLETPSEVERCKYLKLPNKIDTLNTYTTLEPQGFLMIT